MNAVMFSTWMAVGLLTGGLAGMVSTDESHGLVRDLAMLLLEVEVWSTPETVVLARAGKDRLKRSDNARIELALHGLGKPKPRDPTRHGVAIRPIRCHRVICICHRDDPREHRDVAGAKLIRIPKSINAFVMMTDNSRDLSVIIDLRQDSLTDG